MYSVELVIRMSAPKPWNRKTVELVERVLTDKAKAAIETSEHFAREWTKHGEPVQASHEFRLRTDA